METKAIITGLTQEDLVNLLCTATYGSNWLSCYAPDRSMITEEDGDCIEDIWAKVLLAGGKLYCTDFNSEGEVYGTLEQEYGEDGHTTYHITLQDVLDGLRKSTDGTFKVASSNYNNYGENERKFLAHCFNDFANDGDGWDIEEADALMQVIIFGELIYG